MGCCSGKGAQSKVEGSRTKERMLDLQGCTKFSAQDKQEVCAFSVGDTLSTLLTSLKARVAASRLFPGSSSTLPSMPQRPGQGNVALRIEGGCYS